MAGLQLELPTIQNWSCHSCSGCCRQHGIAITDAERERIVSQQWTEADGIPAAQPLFVRMGGWFGRRWWRLAHQPDGRCVFLDDRGLCRIPARFGEPAKPLACRIYPYAFHPKGTRVVVGLRFSCPSVAKNLGRPVAEQRRELLEIARQVVPERAVQSPPPRLSDRKAVDWPDLLRVVRALESTFADDAVPTAVQTLRALTWLDLLDQAQLERIRGPRLDELLDLLRGEAELQVPADFDLTSLAPPRGLGRMMFRLHAGQYARVDSDASGHGSLAGRWRLLRAALRLTRGVGRAPSLHERLPETPFSDLEPPHGPLPAEGEALLARYFRVKLAALHFCGPAYYDVPLIEGFRSLALVLPAVHWIARWLAVSQGRRSRTVDDLAEALSIADHHHGYSPALGTFAARSRVRTLQQLGDLARLIGWYAR